MSECKEFRMNLGKEILLLMEKNEDLPLPNRHRLAKTMQEYFISEGMIDIVKEHGYKWIPSKDYWLMHISDISSHMRKENKLYFGFTREQGTFKGQWKLMNKAEWETSLYRNYADIGTRVDTHNDKIEDTGERWKIEVPLIQEVPLLN